MPYLPSDARKKSELYDNLLSGDILEYQNEIEDLKKKTTISGSVVDAKAPLRDSDGILQSFEGSIDGLALEQDFQQVRLENKQQFFMRKLDNSFTFFEAGQGQGSSTTDTTDSTDTTDEVVQFQATIRDYLVQFVNEYFNEDNRPDISTDGLHVKILKFFKENAKDKKDVNADGWESFRVNTKRDVRGISGKRLIEILKDLKSFRYDEIVEDHLYRTLQGQIIWLKLGFPYIIDKKLN
mgnify:FL=1